MSTAEILSLISTICYVIAAIASALAIFFWISFKIPSVIGDLSGQTAKKSIARMRANNERAGGQGYKPSATNAKRGKLTDTMGHSRKLAPNARKETAPQVQKKAPVPQLQKKTPVQDLDPETGLLAANRADVVVGQQTALLDSTDETAPLMAEETAPLMDEGATEALIDEGATESLADAPAAAPARPGGKRLTMLDDVMLIHTNEVID